jgi:hypothetical protein
MRCWRTLKNSGRVSAERVPLPVQDALKELGLVEVDWLTQDLVMTDAGRTGAKKIQLSAATAPLRTA